MDLSWNPDGTRIVTASSDQTAIIWNTQTGGMINSLMVDPSTVYKVGWSPDGRHIATSMTEKSQIYIWNAENSAMIYILVGHVKSNWTISWNPDGSRLASASNDGTVRIWLIKDIPDGVAETIPQVRTTTIYPNPVQSAFTVRLERESTSTMLITLVNDLGQTVITSAIPPHTKEWNVNVEGLPSGMYMLTIGNQMSKIVLYR